MLSDSGSTDDDYLTPSELVSRYKESITLRTLANWRSKREGPPYTKIGGKVLYHLQSVIEWERQRRRCMRMLIIVGGTAAALLLDCLEVIDWMPGCACIADAAQIFLK